MDFNNLLDIKEQSGEVIAPCEIFVDEEAEWFHKGAKIIREDILELFYEHITLSEKHGYLIEWRNTQCKLDVADTPFVIARVDRLSKAQDHDMILLTLRHIKNPESLAPETLAVGDHNVLYCRIRGGKFPARFSRPAYYQLAEWITEEPGSGRFFLKINGVRHYIAM